MASSNIPETDQEDENSAAASVTLSNDSGDVDHLAEVTFNALNLNEAEVAVTPEFQYRWRPNAIKVLDGLLYPHGLSWEPHTSTIYVVDRYNHRIIALIPNYINGSTLPQRAGLNSRHVIIGQGGKRDLGISLDRPVNAIVDHSGQYLFISDYKNSRVIRWPLNGEQQHVTVPIRSQSYCCGLAIDHKGDVYVSFPYRNEVRRFRDGSRRGTIVAGGNGQGNRLDQLDSPYYIAVDKNLAVYVSDCNNHRVMKWSKGAITGIVVAGGSGPGRSLSKLNSPTGIVVDENEKIYIVDKENNRVLLWTIGEQEGTVIVDGRNTLHRPEGLCFDAHMNLYVADFGGHRIQCFPSESGA